MTTLPRGQDGPPSRLLIHADDPGQANRLALLVSHYGHQPRILDTRQLLTPTDQGDALLVSCRHFGAEVRLGLSLWPDLPRLLFCERLGGDTQFALLQQGVLLVPHPCGEREPVEQWLALPHAWGLTQPASDIGGAHAGYRVYPCADGRVAVAALEPHFAARLCLAAGLADITGDAAVLRDSATHAAIAEFVRQQSRAQLDALAAEKDIPLFTLAGV